VCPSAVRVSGDVAASMGKSLRPASIGVVTELCWVMPCRSRRVWMYAVEVGIHVMDFPVVVCC
jgi:hypothetical protein